VTRHPAVRASFVRAIAVAALVAYLILLGGTAVGETNPALRGINAGLGGVLIAVYVVRLPSAFDRFDALILASVLIFSVVGLLSAMPRQSLDVVVSTLALAAATFVARHLGADRRARWAVMIAMRTVFMVLVVHTLVRWIPPVVDWWLLNDMQVLPPLDLSFHASPWGHRHDLALLVAMLYPSWWVPTPRSRSGKVAAIAVGIPAAGIIVMDGSRALWIAFGIASLIVLYPRLSRFLRRRKLVLPVGVTLLAATVAGLVGGVFAPVVERIFDLQTLGARGTMWASSIRAWQESPVAGYGPGTFVWDLQRTTYFETSSWAPRHPDSVFFQLLPEAGVLGIAAVGLVIAAIGPRLMRPGAGPARWALLAFGVAGLANSPTDFTFLLTVAIVWIGLLVPRVTRPAPRPSTAWVRATASVLLVVIASASVAATAASIAYEEARVAVLEGDLRASESHLTRALMLDPSHALYARQRGIARLLQGNVGGAATDLERAVHLNSSDDLGWRALAVARRTAGDDEGSASALDEALKRQRSDLTNLLLAAEWNAVDGDEDMAREQAAEAVLAVPGLTAASGWVQYARSMSAGSLSIVNLAVDRWVAGKSAPAPIDNQPLELIGIASREDLSDPAVGRSNLPRDLASAAIATFGCSVYSEIELRQLDARTRRLPEYWRLVVAASARLNDPDESAMEILSIMTGVEVTPIGEQRLNPLNENTSPGFSADTWGYERNPIDWPMAEFDLPSPIAGQLRWIAGDPAHSSRELLCESAP
jgi:O-antigen ligase